MARRKSESSVRGKRVAKKAKHTPNRAIDFSDIPELSSEELSQMKRVGRPPLGTDARQLIAIRIDPEVLEKIRKAASKVGKGYQTLINEILAKYANKKSA